MFSQKRSDTTVGTIEDTYNITLNARRDMKLGNLLTERGFESLSQLLKAYRGDSTEPARRRKVFPSFHGDDLAQVNGFRGMVNFKNVDIDLDENRLYTLVGSENMSYVRQELANQIYRCEVLVCLIGNGTKWREMVNWEIEKAIEFHKGICGVRLKGSHGHTPDLLKAHRAPVAGWDTTEIIRVIEQAAARRSWP